MLYSSLLQKEGCHQNKTETSWYMCSMVYTQHCMVPEITLKRVAILSEILEHFRWRKLRHVIVK
jgi:hypothetical protein